MYYLNNHEILYAVYPLYFHLPVRGSFPLHPYFFEDTLVAVAVDYVKYSRPIWPVLFHVTLSKLFDLYLDFLFWVAGVITESAL